MEVVLSVVGVHEVTVDIGPEDTVSTLFQKAQASLSELGLVRQDMGMLTLNIGGQPYSMLASPPQGTACGEGILLGNLPLEGGDRIPVAVTRQAEARLRLRFRGGEPTLAYLQEQVQGMDAEGVRLVLDTELLLPSDIAHATASAARLRCPDQLGLILSMPDHVNPNRPGLDGATPLIACIAPGQPLEEQRDGFAQALEPCIAALVRSGATVDAMTERGYTALMSAARVGDLACVRLLVEGHGADPNLTHPGRSSPLMCAAASGCPGTLAFLLSKGAQADWRNTYGNSAMHDAAESGNPVCLRILAAAWPAGVSQPNATGMTPLHRATAFRKPACMEVLLRADPTCANQQSLQGETPLMRAAKLGAVDVLGGLLLRHGADPALMDDDGLTAYDLAVERGHVDSARLLRTEYSPSPQQG